MNKNIKIEESGLQRVDQACYAVVQKGEEKEVLRSGNLGTCILLYGKNPKTGVAFMAHADIHGYGLGELARKVKAASGNSLEGFELALGMNGAVWIRIVLALILISASSIPTIWPWWYTAVILSFTLYLVIGIPLSIYVFAAFRFRTFNIPWRSPKGWYRCAEVDLSAASAEGLSDPVQDRLLPADGKIQYAPPKGLRFRVRMSDMKSHESADTPKGD